MISPFRSAALFAVIGAAPLTAQQPQGVQSTTAPAARSVLTEAEFARIEQLGAIALSPDGKWIAYDFRRGVSGPTELRFRAVSGGSETSEPLGHAPVFSANSHWLLFTVTPDTASVGRGGGRRGGTPTGGRGAANGEQSRSKVAIVDLRTGKTTVLDDVQSFSLAKDGAHVALRRYTA